MRNLVVILATLFVLLIPATCLSSQFFITLGPEIRYINGHSTYHISFPGVQSELEFPLDNVMAGLKVIAGDKFKENPQQTKSQISLTLITVVDQDAGIMKDSDWIENDGHPGKDIYTESDAKLRGAVFEIRYAYHFRYNDIWTIGPVIGYRYQKFDYDIYGYRGYRYSTPLYGEGKALDYEITYMIPYIGVSSDSLFGKNAQFHISFSYSNWTEVRDRDDHILRYKLSEGECEGKSYLINVGLEWNFLPQWILSVGAEYLDIDTTGTQHQRFYAGSSAGTTYDVDDRISSSLLSGMVRVLYEF